MNVDPTSIGVMGEPPNDGVVSHNAARRMVERGENGIPGMVGEIELWTEPADLLWPDALHRPHRLDL